MRLRACLTRKPFAESEREVATEPDRHRTCAVDAALAFGVERLQTGRSDCPSPPPVEYRMTVQTLATKAKR